MFHPSLSLFLLFSFRPLSFGCPVLASILVVQQLDVLVRHNDFDDSLVIIPVILEDAWSSFAVVLSDLTKIHASIATRMVPRER